MPRTRRRTGLSARDRAVIDLERQWGSGPETAPTKLAEARELGLTPGGYALVLSALVEDPAAHDYDAEVVERLRELRARATGSHSQL